MQRTIPEISLYKICELIFNPIPFYFCDMQLYREPSANITFVSKTQAKTYIEEQTMFQADRLNYIYVKPSPFLVLLIFEFSITSLIISE